MEIIRRYRFRFAVQNFAYALRELVGIRNSFEGWRAHTTNLPIASASAVVVATTSDSEGLMKNLYPTVVSEAWSA
eukprot:30957-Pelagococcus_subviridis.AAC.28